MAREDLVHGGEGSGTPSLLGVGCALAFLLLEISQQLRAHVSHPFLFLWMALFSLAAELAGHEADVRAVCVIPGGQGTIATASRDHTVRIWRPSGEHNAYVCENVLQGHGHFVSALAALAPSADYPLGALYTGSNDKTILFWDLARPVAPVQTLLGHSDSISCLCLRGTDLVSGSWDKTVRIWRNGACIKVHQGHEHSVWSLLPLASGHVLSASADRTIRLWSDTGFVRSYVGHTDAVRGLALLPGVGFVSCSNDCTLKLWALTGECLQTLEGHESFIYSVAVLTSGELASCSEDRNVKVWNLGEGRVVQSIVHPSSVWNVAAAENGDVVTACADGAARIFTREPSRLAPLDVRELYDARVASVLIPRAQNEGLDINTLPGPEALLQDGTRDGQPRIIRRGTQAEAYQWSGAEQRWIKIGDVATSDGGAPTKKVYNGKEYDYIFDVDLEGVMRKLCYNVTENPYKVAQDFIIQEGLDQSFLEQIAQFIFKNAPGITLAPSYNPDPLTGSGQPPPTYLQQQQQPRPSAPPTVRYIPITQPLVFDSANYSGLSKKLDEFKALANPQQIQQLLQLATRLTAGVATASVTEEDFTAVEAIFSWPKEKAFVGLDIVRLLLLNPHGIARYSGAAALLGQRILAIGGSSEDPTPNRLLALRAFVNLFSRVEFRDYCHQHGGDVLQHLAEASVSENVNIRQAFVSLLLKFHFLFIFLAFFD
eukprot:TRINITY_DN2713_c0_g1_i1.p1 TRINITY_DN2713_c0_g1~~TRINITY_DN2713_c0_g1_i1.p1  ORF type:complete len:713 (-),score=154.99 TRINITY_DN2713_c0_g1_i1:38-2176(-)